MTSSTTIDSLRKKYNRFNAPTIEIKVNGADILAKGVVTDLSVELTAGYEASGASFDVSQQYDFKQSDFKKDGPCPSLEVGAKIEISLGYINVETVFSGLISEVSLRFDMDEEPLLHVECVDAKVAMMKNQRVEVRQETDVPKLVSALLGVAPVSNYIDTKEVKFTKTVEIPLRMNQETDYDYIVKLAKYIGCEFFIVAGTVYFRESPASSSVIMTVELTDEILYSASFTMSGAGLVETVRVLGIDPAKDEMIEGKAKTSGKFSAASGGKQLIGGSAKAFFDAYAKTKADLDGRAKTLLADFNGNFGKLELCLQGVPELVPGRDITLDGFATNMNKTFYITKVIHRLDEEGFVTKLEARLSSL